MIAVCSLAAMRGATRPAQEAKPTGDVAKGKAGFVDNGCAGCHGDEAQGAMGPALAGTSLSVDVFTMQVRKPKGSMPAFGAAALPDAQVADIYAYVESLPPVGGGARAAGTSSSSGTSAAAAGSAASGAPASAPRMNVGGAPFVAFNAGTPAGNAAHGKALFAANGCFQCHGYVGQGSSQTGAPRIGPPPIPVAAFANYIRQPAGNMPPYAAKVVPDSDVADIYAYLQTIKNPPPAKDVPLLNQ